MILKLHGYKMGMIRGTEVVCDLFLPSNQTYPNVSFPGQVQFMKKYYVFLLPLYTENKMGIILELWCSGKFSEIYVIMGHLGDSVG